MQEVVMQHIQRATAALLVLACAILTVLAGSSVAKAQAATVFDGARLIVGDGSTIENAAFVIENGRITVVGARGAIPIPPGATRVDLAGRTVIPALIDAH